jgi:serine/threonine protein kinase
MSSTAPVGKSHHLEAQSIEEVAYSPKILSSDEYRINHTNVLGKSPLATVYTGELVPTQHGFSKRKLIAVKFAKGSQGRHLIKHEAGIYNHLCKFPDVSEFVVGYHGLDISITALVMDRMNFTLSECVKRIEESPKRYHIIESTFRPVATKMVQSLMWLHTVVEVVHGDIKPSNFLLRHNPFTLDPDAPQIEIVLSDFGSARRFEQDMIPDGGNTWEYMAPERMNFRASQTPSTKEADVWALAISLLVIITGKAPYEGLTGPRQWALIGQGDPVSYQSNVSLEVLQRMNAAKECIDLINFGLRKDPEDRIRASKWYDLMVDG